VSTWATCTDVPWAMAPLPPIASAPVSVIFITCISHKEMPTDTEHTLGEEVSWTGAVGVCSCYMAVCRVSMKQREEDNE
jgi:hypothetical protein